MYIKYHTHAWFSVCAGSIREGKSQPAHAPYRFSHGGAEEGQSRHGRLIEAEEGGREGGGGRGPEES